MGRKMCDYISGGSHCGRQERFVLVFVVPGHPEAQVRRRTCRDHLEWTDVPGLELEEIE